MRNYYCSNLQLNNSEGLIIQYFMNNACQFIKGKAAHVRCNWKFLINGDKEWMNER